MCVCMCVCVCMYVYALMNRYAHVRASSHIHMNRHLQLVFPVLTYIDTHMDTYMQTRSLALFVDFYTEWVGFNMMILLLRCFKVLHFQGRMVSLCMYVCVCVCGFGQFVTYSLWEG